MKIIYVAAAYICNRNSNFNRPVSAGIPVVCWAASIQCYLLDQLCSSKHMHIPALDWLWRANNKLELRNMNTSS